MNEIEIWDCCAVAKTEVYTVALLDSTGNIGGWVLEMALERGHTVRALVLNMDILDEYSNYVQMEKLYIIEGEIEEEEKIRELLRGVDVVISVLNSPSNNKLIMTTAAEALVEALIDMSDRPRYVIYLMTFNCSEGEKLDDLLY